MDNQQCVFHLLSKAARAGGRHWHTQVEALGVTAVQAKVIVFMQDLDSPTSQQLGQHCGLDGATLTGVIDRLIKQSLIQRVNDLQDKRIKRIEFTAQGSALAQQLKRKQQPSNNEFMDKLNDDEQQQLRALLHKLDV